MGMMRPSPNAQTPLSMVLRKPRPLARIFVTDASKSPVSGISMLSSRLRVSAAEFSGDTDFQNMGGSSQSDFRGWHRIEGDGHAGFIGMKRYGAMPQIRGKKHQSSRLGLYQPSHGVTKTQVGRGFAEF